MKNVTGENGVWERYEEKDDRSCFLKKSNGEGLDFIW